MNALLLDTDAGKVEGWMTARLYTQSLHPCGKGICYAYLVLRSGLDVVLQLREEEELDGVLTHDGSDARLAGLRATWCLGRGTTNGLRGLGGKPSRLGGKPSNSGLGPSTLGCGPFCKRANRNARRLSSRLHSADRKGSGQGGELISARM